MLADCCADAWTRPHGRSGQIQLRCTYPLIAFGYSPTFSSLVIFSSSSPAQLVSTTLSLIYTNSLSTMAILSAASIIRSLSLLHLTLAYYFLTSPGTIGDQNLVFILGAAMGLVRPPTEPKHSILNPTPRITSSLTRTLPSPTHPLSPPPPPQQPSSPSCSPSSGSPTSPPRPSPRKSGPTTGVRKRRCGYFSSSA